MYGILSIAASSISKSAHVPMQLLEDTSQTESHSKRPQKDASVRMGAEYGDGLIALRMAYWLGKLDINVVSGD